MYMSTHTHTAAHTPKRLTLCVCVCWYTIDERMLPTRAYEDHMFWGSFQSTILKGYEQNAPGFVREGVVLTAHLRGRANIDQ